MSHISDFQSQGISELEGNILPFWLDFAQKSYPGVVGADGRIQANAAKSTILMCRALWSFSASFRVTSHAPYLLAAKNLFEFMHHYFFDGVYACLDSFMMVPGISPSQKNVQDNVKFSKKDTIVQAYAIYCLSEYYFVSGNFEAKRWALELFSSLELAARGAQGVYKSHFYPQYRNRSVSQNCDSRVQLHVLEAYTNFYRVTGHKEAFAALNRLIDLFSLRILPPESEKLVLQYDCNWKPISSEESFGHNLEAGWLLVDAVRLLQNSPAQLRAHTALINMIHHTLSCRSTDTLGIPNGIDINNTIDKKMSWWVQAEAVNALLVAYEMSGKLTYLTEAKEMWDFILNKFKDHKLGEWFSLLDENEQPCITHNKVDAWRCSYHTSRVCINVSGMLNDYSRNGIYIKKHNIR